jgi:uncharacterized membrane protein YhaH (DUF805 family)
MNWYIEALKKYAVFSGRARRKEYWMYTLFNAIIVIVLEIVGLLIHTPVPYYIYALAVLLPSLGVLVRRLHDTDRTGWWVLLGWVPFLLLVFCCLDGTPGPNKYGDNPKAVGGYTV